jgi:hypothetical protein
MKVRNEEELGKALKNNVDLIEVEYDLKRKVVRIRAINDVAWMVCIAAMTVGVASIIATAATAGTTAPVNALVATPALAGAVTVMGVPTTISAVGIAVAGGGVASLNKLRNYKVKSISGEKIQLIRK